MTTPEPSPSPATAALALKQTLASLSQSVNPYDLVDPISVYDPVINALSAILNDGDESVAYDSLEVIRNFLADASANEVARVCGGCGCVVDGAPRVVVKFVGLSDRCREDVGRIVDCLVDVGSPRELFAAFCEVLDSQIEESKIPIFFVPLLSGLSKVFQLIQRRHLEQLKVALPIVLKVLRAVLLERDVEENDNLFELFSVAVSIGRCIQETSEKVEKNKNGLFALLGLYVLENIALFSRIRQVQFISKCRPLVLESFKLLKICGFSFLGLMTGTDVGASLCKVVKENGDDLSSCFSSAKHGAAIAVLWGYISGEFSKAAGEQLNDVLDSIRKSRAARWQAIGILRFVLSDVYPWELKSYTIDLMFNIMDTCTNEDCNDSDVDFSTSIITIFSALQAIQQIMIRASDASLRKKAFATLRKVIFDLPSSERFDMIKALITNSNSPSMVAILIDLVRNEVISESNQRISSVELDIKGSSSTFWTQHALELVELILKPPNLGPPLPEHSDSVSSALNLLRSILLVESGGNAHGSGVLGESTLKKVLSEWLLPLRTWVSKIREEHEKDADEFSDQIICALNPVEFVLYRCIELVEEKFKQWK